MYEADVDLSPVEWNEESILKFVCPECNELIFEIYIREKGKDQTGLQSLPKKKGDGHV